MFEYIGKKIQTSLALLEYVSLAGGYTELIDAPNGGERLKRPMSRKYVDGKPDGYVDMSPDGSESCIMFVDGTDMSLEQHTNHYDVLLFRPRIVVWYDERKLDFTGELDTGARVTQDIISSVKSTLFPFFSRVHARFELLTVDPARIWQGYNFKPDDALFMAPYRTFAITFRLKVWQMNCVESTIELNEICC